MGEYLTIAGKSVKIGTCENMYYATFRQLKNCKAKGINEYLNPENGYRYRFPFPDEDGRKLGDYENYDRGVLFQVPRSTGVEICHDTIFLRTDNFSRGTNNPPAVGFRVPCVQSDKFPVEKFDWDKTSERVIFEVVQQKQVDGQLWTIVRCPYCGELSRIDAKEAVAIHEYVMQNGTNEQKEIIKRMLVGYNLVTA